jgi:hypothetical protein
LETFSVKTSIYSQNFNLVQESEETFGLFKVDLGDVSGCKAKRGSLRVLFQFERKDVATKVCFVLWDIPLSGLNYRHIFPIAEQADADFAAGTKCFDEDRCLQRVK